MKILDILLGTKKEKQFFAELDKVSDYVSRISKTFLKLCQNPELAKEQAGEMRLLEHDCDQAISRIFDILDTVSQLPFHHEDIADLISKLDDIVDCIWGAADRIILRYELPGIEKETKLLPMAELLAEMTDEIQVTVSSLKNPRKIKNLNRLIDEMHAKENAVDDLRAEAIKKWHKLSLEDFQQIPLRIAWAEVYDRLEWATNKCVDVIDIVGKFFKKYL